MRIDINYRDGAYEKLSVDFPHGVPDGKSLPIFKETLRVSDDGISYVPLVGVRSGDSMSWVSSIALARRPLSKPMSKGGEAVFPSGKPVGEVTLVGPEEMADVESVGVDGVSFWSRDSRGKLVPDGHDADGGVDPDGVLGYVPAKTDPYSSQYDVPSNAITGGQSGSGMDFGYGRL